MAADVMISRARWQELQSEIERLKAELASACRTIEQEQAIAVQEQQRADDLTLREKALREALELSESWLTSLRPSLNDFGVLVRLDNALKDIRAALSATKSCTEKCGDERCSVQCMYEPDAPLRTPERKNEPEVRA